MAECLACGGPAGASITVPEAMFPTGRTYEYATCRTCGSLVRVSAVTPAALYPPDYYSFRELPAERGGLKDAVRRARDSWLVRGPSWATRRTAVRGGRQLWLWPALVELTTASRYLDVGCGDGTRLRHLWRAGCRNIVGIDPFVVDPRPPVRRASLHEVEPGWDIIAFHHSLEHVEDPVETLRLAARLLSPEGRILVRIPLADSDTAEEFGPAWVGIEAPRHTFVPTTRGMASLAERADLRIGRVVWDSTVNGPIASSHLATGIALEDQRSHRHGPGIVGRRERRLMRRQVRRANARERGDQAAFVLVPA